MDSINYYAEKYHLRAIIGLLLVLILFYFPVLFLGRTLQGPEIFQMDMELKSPPQPENISSWGKVRPQIFNSEQSTVSIANFPQDILLKRMSLSGEFALWEPHEGAGLPFAAQYQTATFFPLHILQSLFPTSTRDWFYIFNIWFAGIFTYCFFIVAGKINRISAFWGACLYMCSGVFSWFIQTTEYTAVAMTLPLVMLATDQLSNEISGKKIGFLAIATALILYAGFPEAAFYAFVLSGTYFIYKISSNKKEFIEKFKHISAFILSTLLGFLIAAPLLFLFLQLYQHGTSLHSGSLEKYNTIAGTSNRTPIFLLAGIILPNLINIPTMPVTLPFAQAWDYVGGYIGIIPLFFLIIGFQLKHIRLKKDFIFFIAFSAVILFMNIGAIPFLWIGKLPIFNQAWSPRWSGASWNFALAVAATYGFYFIQKNTLDNQHWKKIIKKSVWIISLIIYICILPTAQKIKLITPFIINIPSLYHPWTLLFTNVIFFIACISITTYLIFDQNRKKDAFVGCTLISIVSLWYYLARGNIIFTKFSGILTNSANEILSSIIFLIFALFLVGAIYLYIKKNIISAIILGFLIFGLSILYGQYTFPGYPKYQHIERKTPFIQYLQKKSNYNRIFGLNGIISPSYAAVYELYDIRYLSPIDISSYHDFINDYVKKLIFFPQCFNTNPFLFFMNENDIKDDFDFRSDFPKAIDLLSTKYIITLKTQNKNWIQKNHPTWIKQLELVYSDNHVNIFRNSNALPRTFIVDHYQIANTYGKAQEIAMKPEFNIKNTAVLEKNIDPRISQVQLIAHAAIMSYQPNKVIINAKTNKIALLILTDTYYPGWKATIDKKPVKIYRVDGLLRGIFIPEGNHEVEFYYFPTIFKIGLILMFLALLICAIFFSVFRRKF